MPVQSTAGGGLVLLADGGRKKQCVQGTSGQS